MDSGLGPETRLHRLIRVGNDFELERKERDLAGLRRENAKMKRTLKARRKRARRKARRR